jgi:hypothetical protein
VLVVAVNELGIRRRVVAVSAALIVQPFGLCQRSSQRPSVDITRRVRRDELRHRFGGEHRRRDVDDGRTRGPPAARNRCASTVAWRSASAPASETARGSGLCRDCSRTREPQGSPPPSAIGTYPLGEAIRTSVDWTVSSRSSLHLTSERASHGSSQGIAIHREPGDIEETYRPSGYGSWDSARPIPTGWAFVIFRPSKHLVSRTFPRRR